MSYPKKWIDWIDDTDPKDCEYIVRYMIKSGHIIDTAGSWQTQIENVNSYLSDQHRDSATLIVHKLRAAWNQKKNRDPSSGRKTYSFVMSIKIEKKLKELAVDTPINKTLENLINHATELVDEHKMALKEEIEDHKKELEKKWLIQNGLTQKKIEMLKYNYGKLDHAKAFQKKTIEDLYFKVCKYEIILKEHKLETIELTVEQKIQVEQNQKIATRFFENELQSELRLFPKR